MTDKMESRDLITGAWLFLVVFTLSITACDENSPAENDIHNSLTFYTTFGNGFTADYATGNPALYMAPSWDRRDEAERYNGETDHL